MVHFGHLGEQAGEAAQGPNGSPSPGERELEIARKVQARLLPRRVPRLRTLECAGLCAKCGTNLNERRCDCRPAEIDPRWQDLAKLKENK